MMALQAVTDDVETAIQLLRDLSERTNESIQHVTSLIQKLKDGELSTNNGISFLEVKNQLLLNYLTDLSIVMIRKLDGQSIIDDAAVDRLVEGRTVLEKIRPIEHKLKYQIDKLVKTAVQGGIGENDPLRFKPNPKALQSKLDEASSEADDSSNSEDDTKKSKTYKPPRVAPAYYDGDMTSEQRQQKVQERIEKKIRSSRIIKELQAELYEGPEEIIDDANLHRARIDKLEKDRIKYEEENFVRKMETKKEKNLSRQFRTINSVRDVTEFGDISALTGEAGLGIGTGMDEEFAVEGKKRKRKSAGGAKGKGAGGAKRKGKAMKRGSMKKRRR